MVFIFLFGKNDDGGDVVYIGQARTRKSGSYDYMKKYIQIEEIKEQYEILSYYYNILNV